MLMLAASVYSMLPSIETVQQEKDKLVEQFHKTKTYPRKKKKLTRKILQSRYDIVCLEYDMIKNFYSI